MKEFVTISKKRLAQLLTAENELVALHSGGVNSWEWYGEDEWQEIEAENIPDEWDETITEEGED